MFLLAEIADKMPSAFQTLAISSVLALFVVILGAERWWLWAALAATGLAILNWALISELCETGWGTQIVSEMGVGYVVGQFVATNAPVGVTSMLVGPLRRFHLRIERAERGLCPGCGYTLAGLPRPSVCPECGSDV